MIAFFKTIIYTPLYNILIVILNFGWVNAGFAAIILTLLVKIILYPLAKKAAVTQLIMREKQGDLNSIKEKYKDKEQQAVKVMEFYRDNKINPFSSIFTILIQIPIIYSLYHIFFRSGLPSVDKSLLYSFVDAPNSISMMFFGIDISEKSIILAILAAVSAYIQMHFSTPKSDPNTNNQDFSTIMAKQMKFTMPLVVLLISWQISGVVALYWLVSNLFGIAQDFYIKRQLKIS